MEKKLEESEHEADRTETKLNLMESAGIHRVIEAANRNETKLTHMESGIQETDRTRIALWRYINM